LTLVSNGWFHGDRLTHFKYPDYGTGSLVSWDWFNGISSKPYPPDEINIAPIHCWYVDESLQLCEFHKFDGNTTEVTGSAPSVPTVDNIASGQQWGAYTVTTGALNCFKSPLLGTVGLDSKTGALNGFIDEPDSWVAADFHLYNGQSGHIVQEQVSVQVLTEIADSSEFQYSRDTLVIPFNDREAIVHYRQRSTAIKGGSKKTEDARFYTPPNAILYGPNRNSGGSTGFGKAWGVPSPPAQSPENPACFVTGQQCMHVGGPPITQEFGGISPLSALRVIDELIPTSGQKWAYNYANSNPPIYEQTPEAAGQEQLDRLTAANIAAGGSTILANNAAVPTGLGEASDGNERYNHEYTFANPPDFEEFDTGVASAIGGTGLKSGVGWYTISLNDYNVPLEILYGRIFLHYPRSRGHRIR